ncbi:MAG TPA: zinc-binding alcohol dehydrogenase family protein [Candidatus Nanopelagicales bacterium]|nr:zinc-binding alcohol dehydrogenase family protein [Candidatus Nanopelagicales bacterium]
MTARPAALLDEPGGTPRFGERELLPPAGDEVVIRVTAAPITPLDRLCATGRSYFGVPVTPYVPGVQGVGTVESGPIAPGTPVWFATAAGMRPADGSMRGWAAVPERDVVALPAGADPVLVAALGLSAVAAWMAMIGPGRLAAGESVMVLGAGGVVGQSAIQLARGVGAGRVVAVARSAAAREQARRLGADVAVAIDPADDVDSLAARMAAGCAGPVDLVLDPLFGVPAAAALRNLRGGGLLVNLGSSAGETAPIDSSTLRSRQLQIRGYTNSELSTEQRRDALIHIAGEVVAGRLTVDHERVALADVTDAWHRTGPRVVLVP